MSQLVYLASPYSHPSPEVRQARYEAACRATATLMRWGFHVFSPIAHSHGPALYGLPGDWEYWQAFDLAMLEKCDRFAVLRLDGWQESRGVEAELKRARELEMPMAFLDPEAMCETAAKAAAERED